MRAHAGSVTRRRRMLLLGIGLAVALLVVASLSQGAVNDRSDPRNKMGGRSGGNDATRDCWFHHQHEGMRDTHVVVPIFPKEIRVDTEAEALIQVENPWKHGISAYTIELTVFPNAENRTFIRPVGLGTSVLSNPDLVERHEGDLFNQELARVLWDQEAPVVGPVQPPSQRPPANAVVEFQVPQFPEVEYLIFDLLLEYPEGGSLPTSVPNSPSNVVKAEVKGGKRPVEIEDARDERRQLQLGPGSDVPPAPGNWTVTLTYVNGRTDRVNYTLVMTAIFKSDTSGRTYTVIHQERTPPGDAPPRIVIPKNSPTTPIPILLEGLDKGVQRLEVKVTALLWWDHQATTTPDQDLYERFAVMEVTVGDNFVPSDTQLAEAGIDQIHLYQQAGEITGFAAAFLLLPSLLFGGTYGRTSRKLFNALLGGAKRRVMFHNLLSIGLILVSLVHILLFLLEIRYTILMGVLYGGLSSLSLLVLGLTGYYQVPLIQRFGYNGWRYVHLAFGVLVVVLVSLHAVLDGPDFFFIKEQLPSDLAGLNLADK